MEQQEYIDIMKTIGFHEVPEVNTNTKCNIQLTKINEEHGVSLNMHLYKYPTIICDMELIGSTRKSQTGEFNIKQYNECKKMNVDIITVIFGKLYETI